MARYVAVEQQVVAYMDGAWAGIGCCGVRRQQTVGYAVRFDVHGERYAMNFVFCRDANTGSEAHGGIDAFALSPYQYFVG